MTIENLKKKIGKIKSVCFGMGGYDDAMLGISFSLGSDADGWGVGDFRGTWAFPPSEHAEWSLKDQNKIYAETVRFIGSLLKEAKVNDIRELVGKPVEVTFEANALKSWRLLTEAI